MLAVAEINPNLILVAVITGIFGVLQVITSRKTDRKIERVHGEVKTNHGRRAGEYLEDIPKVLNTQAVMTGRLDDLAAKVDNVERQVEVLEGKMDEHTHSDDRRFTQMVETQERTIGAISDLKSA